MSPTRQPSPDQPPWLSRYAGSTEIEAMVARTAPAILGLLADGVPRSKRVIVAALVSCHARDDVLRTLMRLAVTGRVAEIGGKYTRGTIPGPDMG